MAVKPTSAHQPPVLSSLGLAITEHAPLAMATVEGASHIVRYVNPAFCRLLDKPTEQLVGKPFCEMLPEKDECVALLDRVFRTGKSESHTEQQHSKPHPFFWSYTMWPVLADERPVGVMIQVTETAQFHEKTLAMNEALMLGSLRQHEFTEAANSLNTQLQEEITERKQAEKATRDILARFLVLADNIPTLCWTATADGWIFWFNRRWYEYTGTTPQSQEGWGWASVHNPEVLPAVMERWKASIATGQPFEMVFPLKGADGVFRPFLTRIVPLSDEEGRIVQWFGTSTDITNERKAEERQRFLSNELAHRGKNLLAVVQAIVSRSLSGTRPLAEAREVLARRIQALAQSQSALLAKDFEGGPMAEIIRLEFEAFSERVTAAGPDVMLNPRTTQTFALLLHELATNATKHGALSRPDGLVAIDWSIEGAGAEARFKFQWQERGGPPVVPPTRQGFGRILLEKAVAQDFAVQPKMRFAPEGLSYEIDVPLSVIVAGGSSGAKHRNDPS